MTTHRLTFITLALLCTSLFYAPHAQAQEVKRATLSGSWYPGTKSELLALLDGYFAKATPDAIKGDVFALISPHAGIPFSGPVAAYGYKALSTLPIKTVIIIGFSHHTRFDGIAIIDKGAYLTPLGPISIDEPLAAQFIAASPRIVPNQALFDGENSVELQIPFIQYAFKDARIVPLAFGTQDYGDASALADALAAVLKDRSDCLVVASTDLSHYKPYDLSNAADAHLIDTLGRMDGAALYAEAASGTCELCGSMPVVAAVLAAKKLGFDTFTVLKHANSGDTSGRRDAVVGYLSAILSRTAPRADISRTPRGSRTSKTKETRMLTDTQRKRLLKIARDAITSYVRDGKSAVVSEADPILNREMGAFVTLHKAGELRGCIGNIVGHGPLYKTVSSMAVESATGDPRFHTLDPKEIDKVEIEISVLSPLRRVKSHEEITIPGDGVIVRTPRGGGVYLPQVATETGWTKEEFLTSLCRDKAGIAPSSWEDPTTELYAFTAEVFNEKELGRQS